MAKLKQIEYPGWNKKVKPAFTELKNNIDLKQLHDNLEKLGNEIVLQHAKKIALQKQGIVDAYSHYKDGRYLLLIHPQVDGERKKEYIGAKKTHQTAALKAIERYKEWEKVCNVLDKLKYRCERLNTQYETFRDNLDPDKSLQRWYGF